jgi:hypothetical protein
VAKIGYRILMSTENRPSIWGWDKILKVRASKKNKLFIFWPYKTNYLPGRPCKKEQSKVLRSVHFSLEKKKPQHTFLSTMYFENMCGKV